MNTVPDFSAYTFPAIYVRLGSGNARATMPAPYGDGKPYRATLAYDYVEKDGAPFAIRAARAAWNKYAAEMERKHGFTPDPVAMIPGDAGPGRGFVILAVPARIFNA